MQIGDTPVGPEHPPYFVAEAGVNHNGDLEMAEQLIEAAASAGADAVKFQTFRADRLVAEDAETAEYQQEQTGEDSQRELLRQYELTPEEHRHLQQYCADQGVTFLSTPFDRESVELLIELGVPALKLGSGELTNHPLLEHAAKQDVPLIVSTGMSTVEEVTAAYNAIMDVAPDSDLALLHCTSTYPCEVDDVHLRAMQTMDAEFPVPIGYSDHTTLPETPALAVAAGATIVEKHFTLDRSLPGPDHEASLEPDELAKAVELTKQAGQMRGSKKKSPTKAEEENRGKVRKGIYAAVDIPAGKKISSDMLAIRRPATGMSPAEYEDVLNSVAKHSIKEGNPVQTENIEDHV